MIVLQSAACLQLLWVTIKIIKLFYILLVYTKSPISGMHFTFIVHLNSD